MSRSKRFIEATATCEAFRIQSYDWNNTNLVYILADGTNNTQSGVYLIDGTAYISSVEIPENLESEIVSCGLRCGNLNVTQIENIDDIHNAWLYVCQSTVHEVDGALIDEERVSDEMALIASVSLSQSDFIDFDGRNYGYYLDK